jgi:thiamine kinase-like enzyme
MPLPTDTDINALADRIPIFSGVPDIKIAPLTGVISLNNTNYRVTKSGTDYLLRVGAETAHYLGVRRTEEIEAARAAALAGIGPEVLYSEPSGVMVLTFISGRHWTPEDLRDAKNIQRLAEALRRLHAIKTVVANGSEYRRIERLLESAVAMHLDLPIDLEIYCEKLRRIEQARMRDPRAVFGLAHNDFWPNNFLDDGDRLFFVDWEFSGTGDTLIDLATISMGSGYTQTEEAALLAAYGLAEESDLETLQTMKWVVRFFEASWALVMHGLRGSGDEFNYQNHAKTMFAQL